MIYIGYETLFGSPGACPGTPSPGMGGRGIIPLPRVLQVSNYIDTSYIYCTNVGELERAHPGQFRATFDPPRQGGQNRKSRDCARPHCAVDLPFWALIIVHTGEWVMLLPRYRVHISGSIHPLRGYG